MMMIKSKNKPEQFKTLIHAQRDSNFDVEAFFASRAPRPDLHEERHHPQACGAWRAESKPTHELLWSKQRETQRDHRRACGKGAYSQIRRTMGCKEDNQIQSFRKRKRTGKRNSRTL